MRNLKILGLAFVAMLTMAAMGASSASALEFTAEEYPATITGEEEGTENFFQAGLKVECDDVSFHAEANGPTTTLTITPSYNECFTSLGSAAAITMNGCDYLFHAAAGSSTAGTVDLVCPPGAQVSIDDGLCNFHIPAQNNLGGITYTNNGAHVTVDVNTENITANNTRTSPFFCPFPKGHIAGKYVSKVTVIGAGGNGVSVSS